MSKPPFPLQLKHYFFTHQECIANPEHKLIESSQSNAHYDINAVISKINDDNSYGLEVTTTINSEKSNNPPYFIKITAFGIIDIIADIPSEEIEPIINQAGAQLIIGAIRERIAEMTARGPWPSSFIDFVMMI